MKESKSFSASQSRLHGKREKYLHKRCKENHATSSYMPQNRGTSEQSCLSCKFRTLSPDSSVINSRLHNLRPRNKLLNNEHSFTSDYSSCSSLSSVDSLAYQQFINKRITKEGDVVSETSSQCPSDLSDSDYDSDKNTDEYSRDTRNARMLRNQDVTVIIPEQNISEYSRDDFSLEIINENSCVPYVNDYTIPASRVVSVEPHGASFYENQPALIYLPLTQKLRPGDRILCLCSNTPEGISPLWEEMPCSSYTIRGGRIVITALHFSLFAIGIERPYPEAHRKINKHGGTLRMTSIPGLEVNFPTDSCTMEVEAVIRVLHDDSKVNFKEKALASPIIMVGPHGHQFNIESEPVTVSLPIPDYHAITGRFGLGSAQLSIWQSSTNEDEPLVWEKVDIEFDIVTNINGHVSVRFQVSHFSFFKALWDILAGSLYEAKLGVAFFYPYISFSMLCQAFMEENKDTQCFGLEVICYRSDNKWPEVTNYKYRVGSSLKPKLARPGVIIVRLKSELFEADVDAGEDPSLIKEENDFRGREFEKQFACRFKQNPGIDRGAFGKVIVERKVMTGSPELLFEFNLYKTGKEHDTKHECSDRWSAVAIKELAGTLQITEDNNWKKFARHIGFTKSEIHGKLQYSADPFFSMVNLYQERGGTPEEFVQALYEVSRQLRIRTSSPTTSTSSNNSSSLSWTKRFMNLSMTPRKFNDDDSDTGASEGTNSSAPSRKRPSHSSGQSSSSKRRRRFSDVSETMSSSEESSCTDDYRRNARKLSDTDMWKISELMNTMNWRALGRTLGLEESILLNIEHAYKSTGFRECSYQMLLEWKGRKPTKCTFGSLYTALVQENMNSVAKGMSVMKLDEN